MLLLVVDIVGVVVVAILGVVVAAVVAVRNVFLCDAETGTTMTIMIGHLDWRIATFNN